jgi:AcrR family transcriptional regulator
VARKQQKPKQDPLLARILAGGDDPDEPSERILAAATEEAEDFGLRRFTIDDVARRVGLSRVTIYRYFPRKEQLLEAVLLRELRRFLAAIDAAIEPCETLEERLVEGFVFTMTYLQGHALLNRLLRTEPELILPALTVNGGPVVTAGREFVARIVRAEAEAGAGGLSLDDEHIAGVSELLVRTVLTFVLTPDSALGLQTRRGLRRFAQHYLAPVVRSLAASPQTA